MDADRFDTLARSLTEQPSRRTILGLGLGGLLAALPTIFAGTDVAARKRRKKRRNKNNGGGASCPGGCVAPQECQYGSCCLPSGNSGCNLDGGEPPCCAGLTCNFSPFGSPFCGG